MKPTLLQVDKQLCTLRKHLCKFWKHLYKLKNIYANTRENIHAITILCKYIYACSENIYSSSENINAR